MATLRSLPVAALDYLADGDADLVAGVGRQSPLWQKRRRLTFVIQNSSSLFINHVEHLSDRDLDVAVDRHVLRCFAPAAIQQDACRRYACGWWHGFLADDAREHTDAQLSVPPCQRPQIGRYFLSGQWITGLAYPLPLAASNLPNSAESNAKCAHPVAFGQGRDS